MAAKSEQFLWFTAGASRAAPSSVAWRGFALTSVCPFQSSDRVGNISDTKAYSRYKPGSWLWSFWLWGESICLWCHLLGWGACLVSSQIALLFLHRLCPQIFFLFSYISKNVVLFGLLLSASCKAGELIFLDVFLCRGTGLQGALSLGMCETWYLW